MDTPPKYLREALLESHLKHPELRDNTIPFFRRLQKQE